MSATETAAWQPRFNLDLGTANGRAFDDLVSEFNAWIRAEPVTGPLEISTGWHTITPEMAEQLLRRNLPGGNRKAVLGTVAYYAGQMLANDWAATGQPVIFTDDGVLLDAQHRLWACYLSGASFHTYVLTGVPADKKLFAYIDNGKVRTAADALRTSGVDSGIAALVTKILDMRFNYQHGLYTPTSARSLGKRSPVWYVNTAKVTPQAQAAARLAISEYQAASDRIDREVVGFAILEMLETHGDEVVEAFFGALCEEPEPDSPIWHLFKLLDDDAKKLRGRMRRHQILGNLIIVFNAWRAGEKWAAKKPKDKWSLTVAEDFPTFVAPEALAAE